MVSLTLVMVCSNTESSVFVSSTHKEIICRHYSRSSQPFVTRNWNIIAWHEATWASWELVAWALYFLLKKWRSNQLAVPLPPRPSGREELLQRIWRIFPEIFKTRENMFIWMSEKYNYIIVKLNNKPNLQTFLCYYQLNLPSAPWNELLLTLSETNPAFGSWAAF